MATVTRPRAEMDKACLWRLEDIFPTDEAFEKELAAVRGELPKVSAFKGKVASDPKGAIRASFEINKRLSVLYSYAFMKQDQDGADTHSQDMKARAMSLIVAAGAAGAFLEPELLLLPEEDLKALMTDKDFEDYSVYLSELLRQKAHSLSPEEEKLMASAGEVLRAPGEIFGMFDDVDIPFPEVRDENGNDVKLSHANYGVLIRSGDRAVRQAAYEAMMGTFGRFASTVTAMYAAHVKGDIFTASARKYPNTRAMALDRNNIPEKVYDNLIKAVEGALPELKKVLRLRKKCLGVDTLRPYDLYAPLVKDADKKMTYAEAFETVISALKPLGDDYTALLKKARDEGWIDVYPNLNKRSGAYSGGAYGVHPYVLLNHTDDLESCFTLAHELGHSMHTWYSEHAQPYPKADYTLFAAEVASTTNEVLLTRYLMEKYRDDKAMLTMLCNQFIESFRTTVFRQTLFAEFEWQAHRMAEEGRSLNKDDLKALHRSLNEKYYGPECEMDDLIGWEWMRIPHFYRSYYVYVYATGFCAAAAIADKILTEGGSAVAGYKRFLSAGCSVPPIEALRWAGVDMEDVSSVAASLKVFADTVDRLEALLGDE